MTYRNQQLIPDVIVQPRKGKRNLFQYRFWIDAAKPHELQLGEKLEEVRAKRKFAPTIRNSLFLFFELIEGKTDLLRELFPGIVQSIERAAVDRIEPPKADVTELLAQIVDIQKQLAQRPAAYSTEYISPRGETPALPAPDFPGNQPGPKPLNIPKFDLPAFNDEDDDTISIKRDTSTSSAGNFLNSLNALAGNAFVDAAPDDGREARKNFTSGMGNLFSEDDEDF